jgi:hypothetical protein
MRAHVIENGKIVNTIEVERLDALAGIHLIDAANGGATGDGFDEATGHVVPAPAEPQLPDIPQVITCGQGREALYNAGLFGKVQLAIDAIEDADTKWRIQNAWDYRPAWERESPFVAMMAAILGLNDEQTDQLFIDAAQL